MHAMLQTLLLYLIHDKFHCCCCCCCFLLFGVCTVDYYYYSLGSLKDTGMYMRIGIQLTIYFFPHKTETTKTIRYYKMELSQINFAESSERGDPIFRCMSV